MRRFITIALIAVASLVLTAAPSQGIIHELVAAHCAGHQGIHGNVDPPGQLNTRGKSFAAALQKTGIYTFDEGTDQGGVLGLDLMTGTFGPMPSPGAGEVAVTVIVDPTVPSAKLDADADFTWVHLFDDELFDAPLHVYLQFYPLDHPAFEHCPNLP